MSTGIILGASSGIGESTLTHLRLGMQQTWWLSPDKDELDVRDVRAVRSYVRAHAPLDYVVFSVGVNYLEWLGKLTSDDVFNVIDTNLSSFILFLDALVEAQPDHPARVVVVGSDAAERPLRTSIAYCASKAGLHMAVRAAARELGPKGWRLNVVAPGMTDHTGMQRYVDTRVAEVRGWSEEHMRSYEAQQEVVPGRINTNEVAQVILSTLTGPEHLNGSIITINGGR